MFTAEHEELRRSIRRFVDSEINTHVDEWEAAQEWPSHDICKKAGTAGFLGINKPQAYGGMGLDYTFQTVWAEELGRIRSGGIAAALGVQTDMATPALARHGSDALREEFLKPAIAGDIVVCLGVSETGAGSDVASLKTHARKDGSDYVINGGKMWTTNGNKADWICLLCNTSDEGAPHRNKSMIVVPLNLKGVNRATKLKKLGFQGSDTAQVFFDEVRVPQRYRIGDEGQGFVYQMEQFTEERLFSAARTIMQMQCAIDMTVQYTRERMAFEEPLLNHQWIHYTLADLQMEVEALRALVYRAVETYVAGGDVKLLCAAAKLKAGKLSRAIPDACLQFWGGAGYLWDSPISRLVRDTRLTAIGGGAMEVMMGVIAKEMGILPKRRRNV
ncbi:MAG: acyl-CoA dehydrogenase family protein [Variibacter sp.]